MTISSDFDPSAIIRTASRLPERPRLSSAEVKRRAETYLITPPSAELLQAYRLTATGGVLALMHYRTMLNLAPRTIRKYTELGVLERLSDRTPGLRKIGFKEPPSDLRLYTLGPVGHAMAEMENIIAPSGYHATVDRVTHDFLATYVIIGLLQKAKAYGLEWQWHNRYQATLKYADRTGGVEPDGAIRVYNPQSKVSAVYVLELHNESHGQRVPQKLNSYHCVNCYKIVDLAPWWGVRTPTLLAASVAPAVLLGYCNAFSNPDEYARAIFSNMRSGWGHEYLPKNRVYGVLVPRLVNKADPVVWRDVRSSHWFNLLTGERVEVPSAVR
jgi:hypothetical protein